MGKTSNMASGRPSPPPPAAVQEIEQPKPAGPVPETFVIPERRPQVTDRLVFWYAKLGSNGTAVEELAPCAAILTDYDEKTGMAELSVFRPNRAGKPAWERRRRFSNTPKRDCWTWTERGTVADSVPAEVKDEKKPETGVPPAGTGEGKVTF